MSKRLAFGIDLGTVNTCVAVYKDNKSEVVTIDNQRLIPSYVSFGKNEIYIGASALAKKSTFYDSKRFLGRKFHEKSVEDIRFNYPFRIIGHDDGGVVFNMDGIQKRPEEISYEILKYISDKLKIIFKIEDVEAIVTVPAYFTHKQRELTKVVTEKAGIKVLRLFNEPTAAAVSYLHRRDKDVKALIFDLGGGTFDISIINIRQELIEVQCTDGNSFLGGRNFDENIFEYFCRVCRFTLNDSQKKILKKIVSNMKEVLSSQMEVEEIFEYGDEEIPLKLTRSLFEKINEKLFDDCMGVVKRCIMANKISKDSLEEIILVGGSSRIPHFRKLLGDFFGPNKIKCDLDADEAVALGAAIKAHQIIAVDETHVKIKDINPFSIGIRSQYNEMDILIPKNEILPITAVKQFVTTRKNQETILIQVFEGERKYTKYNNCLGEIRLTDIPKGEPGSVIIDLKMIIDENGVVKVESKVGNISKNITLDVHCIGSQLNQITPKKDKAEDELFQLFVELKQKTYLECIRYDPEKKYKDVSNFLKQMGDIDFENLDEITEIYTDFLSTEEHGNLLKKLKIWWSEYCSVRFL